METPKNEIEFSHKFVGRTGRVCVTIKAGEQVFVDEFKVTTAEARARFAAKACERFGALDDQSVLAELERVIKDYASFCERLKSEECDESENESKQEDLADVEILVSIAEDKTQALLFRTPEQHDAQAFAVLTVGATRQTWPIKSTAMRQWLFTQFRERQKRIPSRHALDEAVYAIDAITVQGGNIDQAHLRTAQHEDSIYIDLCDDTWRAVRVSAPGWQIVASSEVPVRFQRHRGMKALPVPERGGSLAELFGFVNVPEGNLRCLFLACLVAYLRPRGPYPILDFNGEQGSAKSTACRRARDLVDPSSAPLRRFPRDDRDLMIAAKNGWVQAYDNISYISPSMSDALSSLATGGGLGTRQLYSDDEEALFCAMRPIMLNGIPDLATRPDLLDRAVVLRLPRIPEEKCVDEETLDAGFRAAHPRILGALFDALSKALARYPHVRPTRVPRMADFARFAMAAAEALGYSEEFLLEAYRANRGEQVEIAIESSPLALAVIALMSVHLEWNGSATDLLSELNRVRGVGDHERAPKSWPTCPSSLSNELRRIAPLLRTRGIEGETGKRHPGDNRDRFVTITKVGNSPSPSVPPVPKPAPEDPVGGGAEQVRDGRACMNCGSRRLWHPRDERPETFRCAVCSPPDPGADVVWINPENASGEAGDA
jgi:hypothetical protein